MIEQGFVSMRVLADCVSRMTGVPAFEILSKRRMNDINAARQMLMWVAYRLTGRSYPEIGRRLDRDHTTIMHGVKMFEARTSEAEREAIGRQVSALIRARDLVPVNDNRKPPPLIKAQEPKPAQPPELPPHKYILEDREHRRSLERSESQLLAALMREHPEMYRPLSRSG